VLHLQKRKIGKRGIFDSVREASAEEPGASHMENAHTWGKKRGELLTLQKEKHRGGKESPEFLGKGRMMERSRFFVCTGGENDRLPGGKEGGTSIFPYKRRVLKGEGQGERLQAGGRVDRSPASAA